MKKYLLFQEWKDYTDDEGNPSTLGEHLQYLRDYGGTPDCIDFAETKAEANKIARRERGPIVIVSKELDYRPVSRISNP